MARGYVCQADWIEEEGGYIAVYGLPGRPLMHVQEDGADVIHESHDDAVANAAAALIEALNSIKPTVINSGVARMAPVEFMAALADLGISTGEFAWLIGQQESAIQRWVTGEKAVPHSACLILEALRDPSMRDILYQRTRELCATAAGAA